MNATGTLQSETILLAEDNDDHVVLIRRAFGKANLLNPLQVVNDGQQAIAYLTGEGIYADRTRYPFPALLLLDLKMPNVDGFGVLKWLRDQKHFPALRVVVLTTSDRIFDMQRAYELGAHSFLTKPVDFRDFVQLGPAIKGQWVWMSQPPGITATTPAPMATPADSVAPLMATPPETVASPPAAAP
ncbi:MAG TPA: response regulator [Candidatus Eisenbacteria bacterium]|nr:response regulator [Candidatus Eisenbacteria bacterium]